MDKTEKKKGIAIGSICFIILCCVLYFPYSIVYWFEWGDDPYASGFPLKPLMPLFVFGLVSFSLGLGIALQNKWILRISQTFLAIIVFIGLLILLNFFIS